MSNHTALNRIALLPAEREQRRAGAPRVRRYRLARLELSVPAAGEDRYAYLKRTYD